jgi:tetratricopeptide (TPR) repeat protein
MDKKNLTLNDTFLSAVQSYKNKDFKNATILCYKILSINPNHLETIMLLASTFVASRDLINAKKMLKNANDIKPNNSAILNNLGTVFTNLKEFRDAEDCYKKVIEIEPNNVNVHYNYGLLYLETKEFTKAKSFFEKTIILQPNFALAFLALANINADLKEYEIAVSNYQKAIKLRPKLVSAHNNLGVVFGKMGDTKNAVDCYKKVVELKVDHVGAQHNLALALKEMGRFDEAIAAHKNAIKYESENLMNYFYLYDLDKSILDSQLKEKSIKIINNKNSPIRNKAFANYLLSKFEKQSSNFEQEFNYLIKGHHNFYNSNKSSFDIKTKYVFENLVQISKSANVNKSNKKNENYLKPIFIVGVPRSGSTLIEKIIGSGDNYIPMGEETTILENFINNKIMHNQSLILGDDNAIRDEISKIYKEKGLALKKHNFTFTDKSLNNYYYLNLIKDMFPNAKIINCNRNPISSIMSIMQNNLTDLAWAHDLENIFRYFDNYFEIMKTFNDANPNYIYNLDFEKFTVDPENESKELMKYCELKWSRKCLDFNDRKDIISKTTSNVQIRKSIFKDTSDKYSAYKFFLDKYGKKYTWYS